MSRATNPLRHLDNNGGFPGSFFLGGLPREVEEEWGTERFSDLVDVELLHP